MRLIHRADGSVDVEVAAGEPLPVKCKCGNVFAPNGPQESTCPKCGHTTKHSEQTWEMVEPAPTN